jgi:O-antigen ligase
VHPKLMLPAMFVTLAILSLPFSFTQVVLAPGSRRAYALAIALAPILSVALGGLLQFAEIRTVFDYERWQNASFRLEGATGNAAVFAMLAFAGFVVAVHEMTRPGRPYAIHLAAINLALVVLSGTRMTMLASALYLAVHVAISPSLRKVLRDHPRQVLLVGSLIATTLILYSPTLWHRVFANDNITSGRDIYWQFYFEQFWFSPLFGRGLGAGFVAGAEWFSFALPVPHNEYLHLLVIGGVVGFTLCLAAIALWYRQLCRMASPNDRELLLALAPALLVYAITDNILIHPTALALYAYLGVLLVMPSPLMLPALEVEASS